MKQPPMILIVGPSGAGKTTTSSLLHLRNNWLPIESYATRTPRYNGEEGHIFITPDEFDKLTDLVAYTEYNGHRYGCTAQQIDDHQIYVVDIPGVESLLANYHGKKEFIAVYLDVSKGERRVRMMGRGDHPANIEERLSNDVDAFAGAYDRLVELLGEDNVLIAGDRCSADVVMMIEEHLIKKGYEWETI